MVMPAGAEIVTRETFESALIMGEAAQAYFREAWSSLQSVEGKDEE